MKSLKTIFVSMIALMATGLLVSACNDSGLSSKPVATPTSYPAYLAQAPACVKSQNYQNLDDLCAQLRDGRVLNCSPQERYNYHQSACKNSHNSNWQGRIDDRDGEKQDGRESRDDGRTRDKHDDIRDGDKHDGRDSRDDGHADDKKKGDDHRDDRDNKGRDPGNRPRHIE